jgi:hypothetical protein
MKEPDGDREFLRDFAHSAFDRLCPASVDIIDM